MISLRHSHQIAVWCFLWLSCRDWTYTVPFGRSAHALEPIFKIRAPHSAWWWHGSIVVRNDCFLLAGKLHSTPTSGSSLRHYKLLYTYYLDPKKIWTAPLKRFFLKFSSYKPILWFQTRRSQKGEIPQPLNHLIVSKRAQICFCIRETWGLPLKTGAMGSKLSVTEIKTKNKHHCSKCASLI